MRSSGSETARRRSRAPTGWTRLATPASCWGARCWNKTGWTRPNRSSPRRKTHSRSSRPVRTGRRRGALRATLRGDAVTTGLRLRANGAPPSRWLSRLRGVLPPPSAGVHGLGADLPPCRARQRPLAVRDRLERRDRPLDRLRTRLRALAGVQRRDEGLADELSRLCRILE